MRNLILTFAALGAMTTASFADNTFAGNNQAPYRIGQPDVTSDVVPLKIKMKHPLAVITDDSVLPSNNGWYTGRYGLTKDPSDIRRWDEKNN